MYSLYFILAILLLTCYKCAAQQQDTPLPVSVPITIIERTAQQQKEGECPVAEFEAVRSKFTQKASDIIQNSINCPCGGAGDWRRIAFLNMSDPNEQCPSNWRLITPPVRACGSTGGARCNSAIFPSGGRPYSQVCGRIIGYQRASPDAFQSNGELNSNYVDGISITHGAAGSRQHIWTMAGAIYEDVCPCNQNLPFVGNDYFCDYGNPTTSNQWERILYSNPIWDGAGCDPATDACCELNNPPWFCKTLPQPTSDDLEVRICHNQDMTDEDTPIAVVDISVQ